MDNANVVIVYRLSDQEPSDKARFRDELYGRHNDGVLSKIPYRKLTRGVIEISQRNFDEVHSVFDKYDINHELRITIPVIKRDEIAEIVKSIKDPYEEALEFDSLHFSSFISKEFEELIKTSIEFNELIERVLAMSDTVDKWVNGHSDDPFAEIFAYVAKALQIGQSEETTKNNIRRVCESLKNWTVGYMILQESEDSESIGEALRKYDSMGK